MKLSQFEQDLRRIDVPESYSSREELEADVLHQFFVTRISQGKIADKVGISKSTVQRIVADFREQTPTERRCQRLDRYWRIPQWRPEEEEAA